MADISKITLPNGNEYNLKDAAARTDLLTKVDDTDVATDSVLGLVKTNSAKNIILNEDNQLEVGGRLGQFPTTNGIYAPDDRDPRFVDNYCFLVTDAMGMDLHASRSMALVSGYSITCKSANAGATEYHISNTYQNRICAKCAEGGYAALNEATSIVQRIVPVVSVQIGGADYTPNSDANSSSAVDDIVIKTEETLNPTAATTNIRLFGKMESFASLHVGNGIASGKNSGRSLMLGGAITKASGNDNCMVGMNLFSSGNGNAIFGRNHIVKKNRGFFAGTGHDSTNARNEAVSAVGEYSSITMSTLFAVGNGTSHTARRNAFEVTTDGGFILNDSNGVRWTATFDTSGNLNVTNGTVTRSTSNATTSKDGFMSSADKRALNTLSTNVGNHTVAKDVPSNAVFTDTTYSVATTLADGLMSSTDKSKLDGISSSYDSATETLTITL